MTNEASVRHIRDTWHDVTERKLCLILAAGAALAVGLVKTGEIELVSATTSNPAASAPHVREVGGVVSTRAIGTLPFGAGPAQLRAWAGKPEFTSPPLASYPVPRHDRDVVVWGYHCQGISVPGRSGRSACHTLFGFRNGRLTAVLTDSPLFALPNGIRPGMTAGEARRKSPRATIDPGCSNLRLPTAEGTTLVAYIVRSTHPRVFSVYAEAGDPALDVEPNYCGG